MRRCLTAACAAITIACAATLTGPASATTLLLRRAVLTLGGVGYFEYTAIPAADGMLTLPVRRDEVDDVLKSLTVTDAGGWRVAGLELAGPDGADSAFEALPFGPPALAHPVAMLNALRGVPVEVRDASGREVVAAGRLLSAVRMPEPQPGNEHAVERTRVTLMSDAGLRQFVLEDVGTLRVADPALQARLETALAAVQGQAADARREVRLTVAGGSGPVRVGVVTAAPLWKASYRLVLPEGAASARLQGWAVLENLSAEDWSDVELSLQSGNPVTFRQALYRPAHVERPEIPVDQQARPLPEPDQRATPDTLEAPPPPPAAMAPAPAGAPVAASAAASRAKTLALSPVVEAATVEGVAATSFTLPAPVSLPAGHTASLPFLDRAVPAEALDLLPARQSHPFAALRVRNETGSSLPGGAVATFDANGFTGDARLAPWPTGEERLLTFAEDGAVTASWSDSGDQAVVALRVSQGVAHLTRRVREVTRISLAGAASGPRHLLIELPRVPEATLAATGASLAERTDASWRLGVDLPPGKTTEVVATSERQEGDELALTDDPQTVLQLLEVGTLPASARAALQHVAALREQETAHGAERDRLVARREEVERDEARLRQNLAAVPPADPLHARLLRQLDAAETTISGLAHDAGQEGEAAQQAHEALAAAIAALSIE